MKAVISPIFVNYQNSTTKKVTIGPMFETLSNKLHSIRILIPLKIRGAGVPSCPICGVANTNAETDYPA